MKTISLLITTLLATSAMADDLLVKVVAKNGGFQPAQLDVPAGTPFVIEVTNEGTKAIEFESKPLRAEKVVPPGKTIKVKVAALKAGSYLFVDEFNEDKARGQVVAK